MKDKESKGEIASWEASRNNKMAMRNLFVRIQYLRKGSNLLEWQGQYEFKIFFVELFIRLTD